MGGSAVVVGWSVAFGASVGVAGTAVGGSSVPGAEVVTNPAVAVGNDVVIGLPLEIAGIGVTGIGPLRLGWREEVLTVISESQGTLTHDPELRL